MTLINFDEIILNKYTLIGVFTVIIAAIASILVYARRGQIGRNICMRVFTVTAILISGSIYLVAVILWLTHPLSVNTSPIGVPLTIYHGHSSKVSAVAWSPDGMHVASGGGDDTVQVWSTATGATILTYSGHINDNSSFVEALSWSPDGTRIASGDNNGMVQVWDAASGRTLLTHVGSSPVWSPDGTRIASGGADNTVQIWNAASGQTILTYHTLAEPVTYIAWSPDGKYIASANVSTEDVQVWNATTGNHIFTYPPTFHGTISALAWSPDGKRIASQYEDGTTQVWGATTGDKVLTHHSSPGSRYRGFHSLGGLAWSPDGKYIASDGSTLTVEGWNSITGKNVFVYNGQCQAGAVAWSPSGKYIASADSEAVNVWQANKQNDTSTSYQQRESGFTRFLLLFCIPVVIVGALLATIAYTRIAPFTIVKAISPAMFVILITAITLSQVISFSQTTHSTKAKPPVLGTTLYSYPGTAVAWSPDGTRIAVGNQQGTVQVISSTFWNILLTYRGHTGPIDSTAWSPDGKHIASVGGGIVQVWDAITGNSLLTYQAHSALVKFAEWSPDGKHIASSSKNDSTETWDVWDVPTGHTIWTYRDIPSSAATLAWSPDNKHIAFIDRSVHVVEANTGKTVFTFTNIYPITDVAWSSDSRYLASTGYDGKVSVRSADTGTPVLTHTGRSEFMTAIAWSPDNKYLAVGDSRGVVQLLKINVKDSVLSIADDPVFSYYGSCMDISKIKWSFDATRIAYASFEDVQVWQAR